MYRGVALVRNAALKAVINKASLSRPVVIYSTRTIFGLNIFKKNSTAAVEAPTEGEYDIQVKKFISQDKKNYDSYGFSYNPHEDVTDKKLKFFMFVTVFMGVLPFIFWYGVMGSAENRTWEMREARKVLEERLAHGEPPINVDFAPADKIEAMVPPPGDWERQWLRQQPTTGCGYYRVNYRFQAATDRLMGGLPFR